MYIILPGPKGGNIKDKIAILFFKKKKKIDRQKSISVFCIIFESVVKIYAVLTYKIESVPIRKILQCN